MRYRLTAEVMTPDGPKTGSGVIQVSYASEINLNGGGRRGSNSVVGEAIPVDLGQGTALQLDIIVGWPDVLDTLMDWGLMRLCRIPMLFSATAIQ